MSSLLQSTSLITCNTCFVTNNGGYDVPWAGNQSCQAVAPTTEIGAEFGLQKDSDVFGGPREVPFRIKHFHSHFASGASVTRARRNGYFLTTHQSDAGSAGIFSQRTKCDFFAFRLMVRRGGGSARRSRRSGCTRTAQHSSRGCSWCTPRARRWRF
eukprot:4559423-Pyramimonas_sp.AAC.2